MNYQNQPQPQTQAQNLPTFQQIDNTGANKQSIYPQQQPNYPNQQGTFAQSQIYNQSQSMYTQQNQTLYRNQTMYTQTQPMYGQPQPQPAFTQTRTIYPQTAPATQMSQMGYQMQMNYSQFPGYMQQGAMRPPSTIYQQLGISQNFPQPTYQPGFPQYPQAGMNYQMTMNQQQQKGGFPYGRGY